MKRFLGLAGNAASSLAESAASSLAGGSAVSSNSRSSRGSGSHSSPRDNHSETSSWPDPDASSSSGSASASQRSAHNVSSTSAHREPQSSEDAQAEIMALLQAGTQVEVLYAMFPPPLVDRVVQQQQQQLTDDIGKPRRGSSRSGFSNFSGIVRPSVGSVGSGGSRYSGYTPPSGDGSRSEASRRRRRHSHREDGSQNSHGTYSSQSRSRSHYSGSSRSYDSRRRSSRGSYHSSQSGSRYSRDSRSRYSGDSQSRYSGDSRSYVSGSSGGSRSGSRKTGGSRNRDSPGDDRQVEVAGWPVSSPETSNHSSENSGQQQQQLPQQLSSPDQEEGSEDSISLSEIMSHRSNSQSGESESRSHSGSDYSRSQGSRSYYSGDSRSRYSGDSRSGSRSYYSGSSRSRSGDSEAFEQDKQDILRLVQLGTDIAVIEDMFSPEIVRRVLDPSERSEDSRSQSTGDSRSRSGSHYSEESEQDMRVTKSGSEEGDGDHQAIAESHKIRLDDATDTSAIGGIVKSHHDEEGDASYAKQAASPTEGEKSDTKETAHDNDNIFLADKAPMEKDDAVSMASQSDHSSSSHEGASLPSDSDNDGGDTLTTKDDGPQTQQPGDPDDVSRGSYSSRSLPSDSDSDFSAEGVEVNNETRVEHDVISDDGDDSERSSRGDNSSYSRPDAASHASEGSDFPGGVHDKLDNDEAPIFDSDVDMDSRVSVDSDQSSSSMEAERVEAQELSEQKDASSSFMDSMVNDKEERAVIADITDMNNPSPEAHQIFDQSVGNDSVSSGSSKADSVDEPKPREDAKTTAPTAIGASTKKSFLDSSESNSESHNDDDEISIASGTDKSSRGVETKKNSFLDSSDSDSSSSNGDLSVDDDLVVDPTPSKQTIPVSPDLSTKDRDHDRGNFESAEMKGESAHSDGDERSSEQKSDELAGELATGPFPSSSAGDGEFSSDEGSDVDKDTHSRHSSGYDSRSEESSNFDDQSGAGSATSKQTDSTNGKNKAQNIGSGNDGVSDKEAGSSYSSRESFDDTDSQATPESARGSYNSDSEGEPDEGQRHDSNPGESGHSSQSQNYGGSDSESAGYSNVDSFAVESSHALSTDTSTNLSTPNAHDGGHSSPSQRSNSVSSSGFSSSQMSSHMDSFALPSEHNLSSQHAAPNQVQSQEAKSDEDDDDDDDVISSSSNSRNGDDHTGEEQDNDSESYTSEGSRSYSEGSAFYESSSEDLNVHSFAVESEHPVSLNQSGSMQEQSSTSGPQQGRTVHSSSSQPSDASSSDDDSQHHSFAIESEHAASASQGTVSGGKQQTLQESVSESQSGSKASSGESGSRSLDQSKSDEEFLSDLETQIVELESEVNKIEAEIENLLETGTKVDVLYTMYSQDEVDRVLKRGTGTVLVAKATDVGKTTEASSEDPLSREVEEEGYADSKSNAEDKSTDEAEKMPAFQHSSGIMGRFFGTKVKKDEVEPTSAEEFKVENDDESDDGSVSSAEDSKAGKTNDIKMPAEQNDLSSSTHSKSSSIMGRFFGIKPKNDTTDDKTSKSALGDVVTDHSGHSSSPSSDDESSMTEEKENETGALNDDSSPCVQDEKEEVQAPSEQEKLSKSASGAGGGLLGLGRLFGMKSKKETDDIEPSEATKTDTAMGMDREENPEESSQDEDLGAICDLLDTGTDRAVLEAMFSPEKIARAIEKAKSGVENDSASPELTKNEVQSEPSSEASAENNSNASSLNSLHSIISAEGSAQEGSSAPRSPYSRSPSAHDASPGRDRSSEGSQGEDGWPVSPASNSRRSCRSYTSKGRSSEGRSSEGSGSFRSQSSGSYGSADDSYYAGDSENRKGEGSFHSQRDGSHGSSDNESYRSQDDGSQHSGSDNDRSYYSDEASQSSYDSEVEEVRDDVERLLKLGTDRTVLEEMYSADLVTRVIELQNKESDDQDTSDGSYDDNNDEQLKDVFVVPPDTGSSERETMSPGNDRNEGASAGSDFTSQSARQKETDSVGSGESRSNDHGQLQGTIYNEASLDDSVASRSDEGLDDGLTSMSPSEGSSRRDEASDGDKDASGHNLSDVGDQDAVEVSGSSAAAFPSEEEVGSYASSDFSTSPSEALNEKSMLHLTLEGVDMANVEGYFGCSDPFFQIDASMKGFEGITMWQNIHRSEHIEKNLNPKWAPVEVSVDLLCQLDLGRPIRISIYDWEKSGKHQPMGHFETTVGDVLQAKASKRKGQWDLSKAFASLSDKGEVMGMIVVADVYTETPPRVKSKKSKRKSRHSVVPDMVDQDSTLCLTLEGVDMKNVERWFGCSDPFFQVETPMKGPSGSIIWQHVHRSEHIDNNLNPRWKPAEINLDLLCQLDLDKPIRFSLFDWEASGRHNPMGHFVTSVNRLLRSKAEKQDDTWQLARAFTTKGDDGQEFGKIVVVDVTLEPADDSKGENENKRKSSTITPNIPVIKVDKKSALALTLEGVNFSNVAGRGGISDPFFEVLIPVQDSNSSTVWKTLFSSEHKQDNLNPRWDPAILVLEELCQRDLDKPIRIAVQDWVENGNHIQMGHFETSVNRLLRSKARREGDTWDLTNSFITTSTEGQEFGRLVVVDVSIDPDGAKDLKTEAKSKEESVSASSAANSFDGSLSEDNRHTDDSEPTDEVLATIRNLLDAGTDREVLVGMFDSRHVAKALAGENRPKKESQRGREFEVSSSSEGASSDYGSDSNSGPEALAHTQENFGASGSNNSQSFDNNSLYSSDGFSSRSSVEHSGSSESPPASSSEKSLVERDEKREIDSVAIAIQDLHDAGTDRSVLKNMFSPADVLRVIGDDEVSQRSAGSSNLSDGLSVESDNRSVSEGSEDSKKAADNDFTAQEEEESHSYSSEASSEESQLVALWGNESEVGGTNVFDKSGPGDGAVDEDPFGAAWPMEDTPLNEDDILAIRNLYDAGTDRDVLVNMFNQDQVTQVLGAESLEGSASFSAGSSEFSDESSERSSSNASSAKRETTKALRGDSPADASKEEQPQGSGGARSEEFDFPTLPHDPLEDQNMFSQDAAVSAVNQGFEDNASSLQKEEVSEGSHSSASSFAPSSSPSSSNSLNDLEGAEKAKTKDIPVEESSSFKVKAKRHDKKREVHPESESLPATQKRTGIDESVSSFGSNILDNSSDSSEASSEESRLKILWGANEKDQKDATDDFVSADNFADDMEWPDTESLQEIPAQSASSKLDEDIMYWLDSGTPLDIVETMYSPDDVARVLRSRENRKSGKDGDTAAETPPNQPGKQNRTVAKGETRGKVTKKKDKKETTKSAESYTESDIHSPTKAESRGTPSKQRSFSSSAEEGAVEPMLVVPDDESGTHNQMEETHMKPTVPHSSWSSSDKSKNILKSDAKIEAAISSHTVSVGKKSSGESSWSSSSKSKLSLASSPQKDLSHETKPHEGLEETVPEASLSLPLSWSSSLSKSKVSVKSRTKIDTVGSKHSSEKARTSAKKQRSSLSSWSSSSNTTGVVDTSDINTDTAKSRQPFGRASIAAKKQRSSRSSWSSSSKTSGRAEKNVLTGPPVLSSFSHPEQTDEKRRAPSRTRQSSNIGDKSRVLPSQEEPKKTILAVQSTVPTLETLQAENERLKRENKKLKKTMAAGVMDGDGISSCATSKSNTVLTESGVGSSALVKENRSLLKKLSTLEQRTLRQSKQLKKAEKDLHVSSSEKIDLQKEIVTLLDTPKGARALAYKRLTDAKVSVYQDKIQEGKQKIRRLEEKNRSYAESLSLTAEKGATFRKQLIVANKKIEIITAENQALASSLDKSLQQQESLHLSLLAATKEWKDRERILEDEIEQEMEQKFKNRFSEYNESLREAAHEIEALSEERDGLTAEVSRLQDVAIDRKQLLLDVNDKLRYTSVDNLEAMARYEKSQKKCHLLSSAVEVLQQNLEDKNKEVLVLHDSTRALQEDLTRAYEEVWVAEQDKNEIVERARELDISLGKYKMTLAEAYEQLDTVTDENAELERSLLQSINECRVLRDANALAETSLQTTEANIQSYHDILNEAKEEMDYISAENKALVEQELYRRPTQKHAYSFPRQGGYYDSR